MENRPETIIHRMEVSAAYFTQYDDTSFEEKIDFLVRKGASTIIIPELGLEYEIDADSIEVMRRELAPLYETDESLITALCKTHQKKKERLVYVKQISLADLITFSSITVTTFFVVLLGSINSGDLWIFIIYFITIFQLCKLSILMSIFKIGRRLE